MAVLRLGCVHARITDLDDFKRHYGDTMGLYPVLEQPGRASYKGWDEWDHHSVVLEHGGVGLVKLGFKVADPADIDVIEKRAETFGCTVERMNAGENQEVSDGIRMLLPSLHVLELYDEMTVLGTEVGTHNPESFPRHLVGVGGPAHRPRVDHRRRRRHDGAVLPGGARFPPLGTARDVARSGRRVPRHLDDCGEHRPRHRGAEGAPTAPLRLRAR